MKHKALIIFSGVCGLHVMLIAVLCLANGCKAPEALRTRKYIAATPPSGASNAPLTIEESEILTVKKNDQTVFQEKVTVKGAELPPIPKTPGLTYTVKKNDSLWKIAGMYGVSVAELASFNNLDPRKMLKIGQIINIPPGGKFNPAYKARRTVKSSHVPKKPVAKSTRSVVPLTGAAISGNTYTVQSGDSLWKISRKLKVRSSDLAKANNLTKNSVLQVGQKLVIPGASGIAATATAKNSEEKSSKAMDELLNSVEAKTPATVKTDTVKPVSTVPATPAATMDTETIEVPDDVTIDKFCRDFGIKIEALKKLNHDLPADGKLKAGRMIIIPK